MPNGHAGLVELLKVNLALCDGVARHTASNILKQTEEEWASQAPGGRGGVGDGLLRTGKSFARRWPPVK